MTRRISGLLIIAVLIASTVWAQQKEELTPRVYEIKYKKADDIAKLLLGMNVELVPGSINAAFNTFTVRASEQGHAAVADLIQKYDVPDKTIEFQFFLIRARTSGEGLKDGLPEKVQKVIKEVAGLTRYKSFEVIDSPFIRAQEGKMSHLTGKGIYDYEIMFLVQSGLSIASAEDKKRQIRIDNFRISFHASEAKAPAVVLGDLTTSFNIAEGETIVIGASQVEQEGKEPGAAIITIVTAKIL